MRLFAIFVAVIVLPVAAASQASPKAPPPPPPPAIFVFPKSTEISTFRSWADSFSVDFAGRVSESSEKAGQFVIRTYSARRIGTRSTVIAYDFGPETAGKVDKDSFLEDLRDELLRKEGSELVSDEEIAVDGFPGREIVAQSGYERETTRVIFTDTRIFRLSVFVTNWHIISDDTRLQFEKEKDRFFGSFRAGKRFDIGGAFGFRETGVDRPRTTPAKLELEGSVIPSPAARKNFGQHASVNKWNS